jgi:hypothetical protein
MAPLKALALGLALTLGLAFSAVAGDPPKGMTTYELQGKVGPYPVGASITVEDHVRFVEGHYFYASKLADIPLTGKVDGETVTFEEPGGGVFRLHLVTNSATKQRPLTFYTSTGLQGTWAQGGKTLPVTLGFGGVYDGGAPTRWYADVTDEPDAAFEARVRKFRTAVLAGDKAGAAAAVSYPLRVNGAHRPTMIRNKADLIAHWNTIFTPAFNTRLRDTLAHEMFVHNGNAMLGDGLVWFDAKGASAINAD